MEQVDRTRIMACLGDDSGRQQSDRTPHTTQCSQWREGDETRTECRQARFEQEAVRAQPESHTQNRTHKYLGDNRGREQRDGTRQHLFDRRRVACTQKRSRGARIESSPQCQADNMPIASSSKGSRCSYHTAGTKNEATSGHPIRQVENTREGLTRTQAAKLDRHG